MIHNLATKMASIFVFQEICDKEDADIYTYACEAIISAVVNIIIATVVSLLLGHVVSGITYTLAFALLRRHTGGHHAKSHFRCILVFNCMLVISIGIAFFISEMAIQNIIVFAITTVAGLGIYFLAPVECANKQLSVEQSLTARKKSRVLTIVFCALCVVDLYVVRAGIGIMLSLSLFSVLGSMIYAKAVNQINTERVNVI